MLVGDYYNDTILFERFEDTADFSRQYRERYSAAPGALAFLGYRACKAALRAIDVADVEDREAILRAARSPEFLEAAHGTLKPALAAYVVRGGKFEFLEEVR